MRNVHNVEWLGLKKRKEKENLSNSSKKMGDSRYRVPLLRGLLVNAVRYEENRILTEAVAILRLLYNMHDGVILLLRPESFTFFLS